MEKIDHFELDVDGELVNSFSIKDGSYIKFPDHPIKKYTWGCVDKTVELKKLIPYNGRNVNLDFDKDNNLIGIEIY